MTAYDLLRTAGEISKTAATLARIEGACNRERTHGRELTVNMAIESIGVGYDAEALSAAAACGVNLSDIDSRAHARATTLRACWAKPEETQTP